MYRTDSLRVVELSRVIVEASSGLRHDLKNRLGTIRNMAFLVNRRVTGSEVARLEPRIAQFLASIENEVVQANALLDAWTERVGSLHERRARPVEASEVVELAVMSARLEGRVGVRVSTEEATLHADPLELALSLRCLIENAAEAAGMGIIEVSGKRNEPVYRFSVRDHGPGISEPASGRQGPVSTKAGHLGVGLAMARRIVEAAGGELRHCSQEEGGTATELVLPIPQDDAATARSTG